MKVRRIWPALLAAAALAAGGCAGKVDTPAKSGGDVSVVFSNIAETPTLDPAVAYSSDGFEFVRNVYEGLVEYVPGEMGTRPGLATEWTTSEDHRSYTFTLRPNVKFQDGSTLDAETVVTGLKRTKEVNQGPATLMSNVDTITADGTDKVTITLKQPDVYFLGKLPKLPIVSKKAIDEHKTAADPLAKEWFGANSAGTGPYQLVSWKRNQAIELKKYDGYWRPFEAGTPTKVTLRVDADVQTALQLLGKGEIDMLGAVGPDESAAASKMDGVKLIEQPAYLLQTVPLNVTKGPLTDVRVRKAISLAFDYDAMIKYYQGYAELATGPLPTDFAKELAALPKPKRDVEQAKRLLAEAGHANGFTVTYLGLKGLSYEEFTGTLLQQNLKDIGITVKQQLVPWPQMVEVMSKKDSSAEMSFLNMSAISDDPSAMLSTAYSSASIASKGGYNWSYVEDADLDAKIAGLPALDDEATRGQRVADVVKSINDQYYAIYVAQPRLAQPVRKEWTVKYESIDYNYVVRFFFARKSS